MSYSVNCSILLTDLPLTERPAAAKAAGFDAVEFWWPFASPQPDRAQVDAFVGTIQDAGVQLSGLNFFAGDMPGGDRGILSWPAHRDDFLRNIELVVEIGGRLECRAFNALYGNRIEGSDPAEQDDVARQNLADAARAVAAIGGVVLLEPVSGAPAYPLKTAADVLTVIEQLETQHSVRNVRLLADFYHLAVNGDDVEQVIADHAGEFGHVQIADAPGRGEPGTGDLPLQQWIDASRAGGYSGYVGLEYKATAADPFAWLPRASRTAG